MNLLQKSFCPRTQEFFFCFVYKIPVIGYWGMGNRANEERKIKWNQIEVSLWLSLLFHR